ncbi:MAG: diguanylate cyclase [Acidobacteriota bacterium]|nr:diguanylate cyclase [Acidobacteriota bacterium]
MRMLQRTSQDDLTDFKRSLRQGADEIARRWLEAVRADAAVPSTVGMEEPLLLDAVPLVLDEILRVTELDDSKIDHEKICSAARHGRERARQHFDVRELVSEYQHLREQILRYLHEHHQQFAKRDVGEMLTIYARVGLAIDEAMRETINAYVEEHMGQLRHLSSTDSLTGLYNHRTFYERLDEELKRATRYDSPLSIVLIDLDNFKSVNDTNGHQFGDYLLVKCAEWLRHELRQTDVICRYGGDEFGVILPETTREHARSMMCRLTDTFKKLGRQEGTPPSFGMSFGLAAHPEDNGTVRRLVQVADERLLLNKPGRAFTGALVLERRCRQQTRRRFYQCVTNRN